MCGRVSVAITVSDLKIYLDKTYGIKEISKDIQLPRYNVSPGQSVIALLSDGTKFRCGLIHWGFVPPFSKDKKIAYQMINAKSETLRVKKAFKGSFETKRCVILADGFYEWQTQQTSKQAYRITMPHKGVFGMAGLYTIWHDEDKKFFSTTIITTSANGDMSKIHDRMPVILSEAEAKIWLDPSHKDLDFLQQLLKPFKDTLNIYPVSSKVNDSSYDEEDVTYEITPIIEPFI